MYTNPSTADFIEYFSRDFPITDNPNTGIQDSDITKAFVQVNYSINQGLFVDQSNYNLGYLYLSAHYLVTNLRNSSQGINGQYNWLEQSKGVGAVNAAYSIPQRILDNPYWSQLTKTNYGSMYIQLLLPQLCGNVFSVLGSTRP